MNEAIVETEVKKYELRVLAPFVFTHPAEEHVRVTSETRFLPGIYQVTAEVAEHPWIKAGADGKIESAAQAKVRRAEETARQAAQAEENSKATAEAEAAVRRLAKADATTGKASAEEIEKELNTPINKLRKTGAGGAGVTAKP